MATIDETKLQYLLDRAAISDVQLRHATGVDTRDWALYRSCFTDEGRDRLHLGLRRRAAPRQSRSLGRTARRTVSGLKATQHMITNHVITIDGDEGTCVAYVQARHHLPNHAGGSDQTMFGYYTNRFVRTPEGWKIRACKLTVTWNAGNRHVLELARRRLDEAEGRRQG
jgi:3-phenylpropionate/cinnamic acid dioxygenase small subunit